MGTLHALSLGMKFLKLYLVSYFVLCIGAGLVLWQARVLDDIPTIWLAIGIIAAVGFGIMLAVASSPRVTNMTTRDV